MKAGWLALGLAISIWAGCGCRQEIHMPAPEAPDAPQWGRSKGAPKPVEPARPKAKPKAVSQAEPAETGKLPPLSSFPASREPPIYGLALEFKVDVPKTPQEITEPSPPASKSPSGKSAPSKPRPLRLW